MLDEKGGQNFLDHIHKLWIDPEIERRKAEGRLTGKLGIRCCLIKLPTGQQPIVEFNEEICWLATVKKRQGIAFEKGDPVYLQQVESIASVERPKVDGKPVPFVYLSVTADSSLKIIFDFSPTLPDGYEKPPESDEWNLGKSIAESINDEWMGQVVKLHDAWQTQIQGIGLWPAPSLLLYPMSEIADLCGQGNFEKARKVLVEHCNPDFLEKIVGEWDDVPAFADRKQVFADALVAHRAHQYTLTIPALVPHFEGVITDWIITKLPAGTAKWRQQSKTSQFKEVLTTGVNHSFVDRRIIEAALNFILNGPVLATFTDWFSPIGDEFPNRNVVGHGKFDRSLHTEENSIKAFLLLDTLHYLMASHDPT